ncbi:hypothetical protein F5Y15DRAFT_399780 [Xylariaceae sp. FL0016]|nr:hypothetical protein F5Y15DRAFT_399780 [Xylariaceae sp. FL0016]
MFEQFVLLAIGLGVIGLRTYARARITGVKNLAADDYVMLLAAIPYTAEAILAYLLLTKWYNRTNNRMSAAERIALDPHGEEFALRVGGSKAAIANYILYTLLIWMMKIAMLVFFLRLTNRLGKYTRRIYFGFVLAGVSWISVLMNILLSCHPFPRYWQINPDPGMYCHASVSPANLFVTLALNVSTDIYILGIPLPLLWMASIKFWKKLGLIILVSGSLFVICIGCLRCYLIFSSVETGVDRASRWTVRVTFVSVVTTNLPLLFPLIRRWFNAPLRLLFGARVKDPNMRQLRTITALAESRATQDHKRELETMLQPVSRSYLKGEVWRPSRPEDVHLGEFKTESTTRGSENVENLV